MPVDISTQTKGLFTRIDERQEPIELLEITALAEAMADTPPTPFAVDVDVVAGSHSLGKRSGWRNLGIAAAATAAVILLVGSVAWLSRLGDSGDPADQAPTATTTVPPGVVEGLATVPTVLPPTITWEEDVVFEIGEGPQHGLVRPGTDQILVLQTANEGIANGDPRTILWTSPNGKQWEEHTLETPEASNPAIVGEAHGTYVLAGSEGDEPRTYLSTDLVDWTVWDVPLPVYRIASTDDAVVGVWNESVIRTTPDFKDTQIIEPFGAGVAGANGSLVATSDRFYTVVHSNQAGASVWSSADGIVWVSEIEDAELGSGLGPMVAVHGERVLAYMPEGLGSSSPWWIADSGEPFQQVDGPDHGGETTIAGTDDGFVVQFHQSLGQGKEFIAYTTVDGTQWQSQPSAAWDNWEWIGTSAQSTIFAAAVDRDGQPLFGGGHWVIGTTKPQSVSTQGPNAATEPGVWYPVPGALEDADSEASDDGLFDMADTPYGIVGTSGQGLWISQDGTMWEKYARDTIEFAGGESFARIASSDLGILVIEPVTGPEVWHSADGTEWVEVQIPDFPQSVSVRIAATDEAFVVAGDGRIWRSTDGIEWVETVVDADVFNSGIANISTLEATPFGFVAGGSERSFPTEPSDTPNRGRNAIWHSDNGLTWARATDLPGEPRPIDESIDDLAGSDLGVVAVTSTGAIWFSPDAINWTEVLPPRMTTDWVDSTVGASSTGFVVASDDIWGDSLEPRVLTTVDGTTWLVAGYMTPGGEYPTQGPNAFGVLMREAIPLGIGFLIATEGGSSPVHIYEP